MKSPPGRSPTTSRALSSGVHHRRRVRTVTPGPCPSGWGSWRWGHGHRPNMEGLREHLPLSLAIWRGSGRTHMHSDLTVISRVCAGICGASCRWNPLSWTYKECSTVKMTTAVVGAAACLLAAATLAAPVAPQAGATVRSSVDIAAPSSFSNYTVGCHYEVRVKVDDATTPVRLVGAPRLAVPTDGRPAIPPPTPRSGVDADQPGRRTLMAVQPTRGRMVWQQAHHGFRLQRPRGVRALLRSEAL